MTWSKTDRGNFCSAVKLWGATDLSLRAKMDVISGGQNLAGHFVQSSIRSEIVLKYSATRQIMLCSKSGTFPLLVHFIDQLKYKCGSATVHILNDSTLTSSSFQRMIKSRRFLEMSTRWHARCCQVALVIFHS